MTMREHDREARREMMMEDDQDIDGAPQLRVICAHGALREASSAAMMTMRVVIGVESAARVARVRIARLRYLCCADDVACVIR